ncbi:MAG TPA: CinA family protein [Opitutaceae bacterium]|nr:CinA family protein [Opitutaceae bacterium]
MLKRLMLSTPRLRLAVAESMTAGHLQALIAAEAGASEFFAGGITAYTIEQKVRHLGVDRAEAAPVDCVSAAVAWQMARGACALFGAEVAVATTGYAEAAPARGFPEAGLFWALCHRLPDNREIRREARLALPAATRGEAQARGAEAAYLALVAHLQQWRAAG